MVKSNTQYLDSKTYSKLGELFVILTAAKKFLLV